MSSDVIARLVDELSEVTDPAEAMSMERIDSYVGRDLHDFAWELAVARWASLSADAPSSHRVAERDCEDAAVRLDAIGLHAEADTVRAWPQTLERGRCQP